jgi:hypothetical protein
VSVVDRVLNDKSEKYNFIEVSVRWNEMKCNGARYGP